MKVDYSNLYFNEKLLCEINGKSWSFSIELNDFYGNPDCKVGDFSNNEWFRTPYGVKGLKYTTVNRLKRAVEKTLLSKSRFYVCNIRWVSTDR